MAFSANKPFHTYENALYDDQASTTTTTTNSHYVPSTLANNIVCSATAPTATTTVACNTNGSIAINKAAVESPFPDPVHDPSNIPTTSPATRILSTTDSTGTTRMLTSRAVPGQNLVTKLVNFPCQSPMDSLKEWSVSTFKCTKQLINERRGICSITNDAQLKTDIELLRENRSRLIQMLRTGQQMTNHYKQLVNSQRQLYSLMNEMSIKSFTSDYVNNTTSSNHSGSKQIVASFSSLGTNLSSTTTTNSSEQSDDFSPVWNHLKTANKNLVDDFKKNANGLNNAIKNGEKLVVALNFFCSNLTTLINKTIEDTLITVKQYELARLEYDAERNSLNFTSPTAQTSITYSSDKLEFARIRYEQLKDDVQIKLRLLEENTTKVMHKQLLIFNEAFLAYSSGNTAALEFSLRQFNIR